MTCVKKNAARGSRRAGWLIAVSTLCVSAHAAHFDIHGGIRFEMPSVWMLGSYGVAGAVSASREVLHNESANGRSWQGRASSGADAFGLHASTHVAGTNIPSGGVGGWHFVATAGALAVYTDFVITGPAGAAPIQTLLNLQLSGEQILGSYTSMSPVYTSMVESAVALQVQAGSNSGAVGTKVFNYRNGVAAPAVRTGLLANFGDLANVPTVLQTPVWTLPVNTPFTVTLLLPTSATVGVVFSDSYVTAALGDFGHTLGFATDRPVFDLPAGYTAHSADAGIVNNLFTTPVPEPASWAMAALGLAAVGAGARRRRRRASANPGAASAPDSTPVADAGAATTSITHPT